MAASRLAVALGLLLMTTSGALANNLFTLIGDDLSDQDNLLDLTDDAAPNTKVYKPDGRFTDAGPGVWVDYLTGDSAKPPVAFRNYAVGGSKACDFPEFAGEDDIPSGKGQAVNFLDKLEDKKYNEVYKGGKLRKHYGFVWIGHNDVATVGKLSDAEAEKLPTRVVDCIANTSKALLDSDYNDGLVIGTLLPLDKAPAFKKDAEATKALVDAVNAGLKKLAADLKKANPNKTIELWDAHNTTESLLKNVTAAGFEFADEPCITGGPGYNYLNGSTPESECDEASVHVFYDDVHPTTHVHGLVAQDLATFLEDKGYVDFKIPVSLKKPKAKKPKRMLRL